MEVLSFKSWEEIASWTIDNDRQGNKTLRPGDIKYKDQNGDKVINGMDERPIGSLAGYLEHNRIKEHCESEPLPEAKQMLAILSQDNDTLIREIRKDIEQLEKEEDTDDAGTTNFLEDMIEKKEKTAWMIRAYLEK